MSSIREMMSELRPISVEMSVVELRLVRSALSRLRTFENGKLRAIERGKSQPRSEREQLEYIASIERLRRQVHRVIVEEEAHA